MASTPGGSQYQPLYNLIQSRIGTSLTEHQRRDVVSLVEQFMTSTGSGGFDNLLATLSRESLDHPFWRPLVNAATIGETYFFRNQYQFDALRWAVLPALINERRQADHKHLRLWSAGCAGGEEPYSLGMLLQDLLPDIDSWSITILGTDVNLSSLEQARRGLYRAWAFRSETPSDMVERWFRLTTEGYQLSSVIRNMVTFAPLNLVVDEYPSFATGTMNMDVIVCRNVTIYFAQAITGQIVQRFNQALTPDGWLVVGHAEPMTSPYEAWFVPRNFDNTVLYQKRRLDGDTAQEPMFSASAAPFPTLPPCTAVRVQNRRDLGETKAQSTAHGWLTYLKRAKQAADHEAWDEAMHWLAAAERQNRLQPHVHYLRGLVHLQSGSPEKAYSSLRQAVYCDPAFALAHYTLAELHEKQGEMKEAIRCLRLAQAAIANLDPSCPLASGEELTAGMLQELLTFQMTRLAGLSTGGRHVHL